MNYKTTITLLATDLQAGDTLRVICPRCGGGSTEEKSLSVTRSEDGVLLWQCFRDKCPEKKGDSSVDSSYIPSLERKEVRKPRKVFDGTTKALTDTHLARLKAMWGIESPPYWYYTPDYGGRIAMSIRGPKYTHRGWVLRDIRGVARTKAYTFLEEGQESLSWYKNHSDRPTVLVEDIPSAVRASHYVNSVALIGTAIGLDKALEIAQYATRPIVIALDQDATAKSFQHAERYGLMWDGPEILTLNKDMKDMSHDELQELLQ